MSQPRLSAAAAMAPLVKRVAGPMNSLIFRPSDSVEKSSSPKSY
jgi:hypothetical protein